MAQDAEDRDAQPKSEPISVGPESVRAPRTQAPDSAPPVTPRSFASESTELDLHPPRTTSNPPPAKPADPDTLISAPRPAERDELEIKERFRLLEDRIDELDARMRMLEQKRVELPLARSQPWWIWLIFLLGLAVTWQLLQRFR
jgi:hypothetical protein